MKSVNPEDPARRRHLWERLVFLVRARTDEEARARAEALARVKEHEYIAAAGNPVRWTFQGVEEVQPLHDRDIMEGTEVYWEFVERVDAAPDTPPSQSGA